MHVFDALKLMLDKDIGSLLVIEFSKLAGIFTERDYARKLVLQGRSSQNTLVRDVMSTKLITVKPTDTLDFCMKLVTEKRIRHLPVLDKYTVYLLCLQWQSFYHTINAFVCQIHYLKTQYFPWLY